MSKRNLLFFPMLILLLSVSQGQTGSLSVQHRMMFGDTSRIGVPFSKDPHIFRDKNGKTYLFYQGNNDNGKTWFISNVEVKWNKSGPYLKK